MKSKIFQICAGISMVLVSLSIFVWSVSQTTASPTTPPTPDKFIKAGVTQVGKYMMEMNTVLTADGNTMYHHVLVWDTETGKSKYYYFDRDGRPSSWKAFGKDLPEAPLN